MELRDMPERFRRHSSDSGGGNGGERVFEEGEIDPRTLKGNRRLDYLRDWRDAYGNPMPRSQVLTYAADPNKVVPFLPTEEDKAVAQQALEAERERLIKGRTVNLPANPAITPPASGLERPTRIVTPQATERRIPSPDSPIWERLKNMGSKVAKEIWGKKAAEEAARQAEEKKLQDRLAQMSKFTPKPPPHGK